MFLHFQEAKLALDGVPTIQSISKRQMEYIQKVSFELYIMSEVIVYRISLPRKEENEYAC